MSRRLRKLVGARRQDPRGPAVPDLAGYAFEKFSSFRPFELLSGNFVIDSPKPGFSESLHALSPEPLLAPYVACELELDGSSAGAGVMGPGLAVHGYFDSAGGTQQIVVAVNGNTRVVASSKAQAGAGANVAVTVTENAVTLWVRPEGRWKAFLTHRLDPETEGDLRAAAATRQLRPASVGNPESLRAGYFGHTGLRDPQLVKYADGSNYLADGRLLATMTCAGPGPFQTAHWGVFSIAPDDPCDIAQVAHLFFERDGRILGDHAGHIVLDDVTGMRHHPGQLVG